MRLSIRACYGYIMMLELALLYNKGPIHLKDISKSQDISFKYLQQLTIPLRVAGLVKSSSGAYGGYFLACPPDQIRLSQVINTMEGSLSLVDCIDHPDICDRYNHCIPVDIWAKRSRKLFETLDSIALQGMVKRHKQKINKL